MFFKDNPLKLFSWDHLALKNKNNILLQIPVKFGEIVVHATLELPLTFPQKKKLEEANKKARFGFRPCQENGCLHTSAVIRSSGCFVPFSSCRHGSSFFFTNKQNKRQKEKHC